MKSGITEVKKVQEVVLKEFLYREREGAWLRLYLKSGSTEDEQVDGRGCYSGRVQGAKIEQKRK